MRSHAPARVYIQTPGQAQPAPSGGTCGLDSGGHRENGGFRCRP
jgi:hypothetical protein